MNGFTALPLGLGLSILFVAPPFALLYWIMWPFSAARLPRRPLRFTIVDFFSFGLLFQVFAAFAVAGGRWQSANRAEVGFFAAIALLVSFILWYSGVRRLSNAGVESRLQRFVFLTIVMPVTCLGSPLFTMPLMAISLGLIAGDRSSASPGAAMIAVGCSVLGVCLALCGVYTRWLVREAGAGRGDRAIGVVNREAVQLQSPGSP